jgi:hypothetical protein
VAAGEPGGSPGRFEFYFAKRTRTCTDPTLPARSLAVALITCQPRVATTHEMLAEFVEQIDDPSSVMLRSAMPDGSWALTRTVKGEDTTAPSPRFENWTAGGVVSPADDGGGVEVDVGELAVGS